MIHRDSVVQQLETYARQCLEELQRFQQVQRNYSAAVKALRALKAEKSKPPQGKPPQGGAARGEIKAKVLAVFAQHPGPVTIAQLKAGTGRGSETVLNVCYRLEKEGRLKRIQTEKERLWVLTGKAAPVPKAGKRRAAVVNINQTLTALASMPNGGNAREVAQKLGDPGLTKRIGVQLPNLRASGYLIGKNGHYKLSAAGQSRVAESIS